MPAEAVLALDVGTSSVRCLAFDSAGEPLPGIAADREHTPRATADGGAELDAPALLQSSVACLQEAAAALADAGLRPLGVGVCTFWHATCGVDAAGEPTTPVLLWNDTRSAPQAAALRERLDAEAVRRRTGCVLHPSYLPARLAWLRDALPDAFARSARFLSFGEYLEQALFGEPRCSVSMASGTGLYDQQAGTWDAEVLAAVGIDAERLAPLCEGHPGRSGLLPRWREVLPALADVPFFPALGDGACSNVGSGGTRAAEAAVNLGTSAAVRLLFAEETPEPPAGLWRYRLDASRGLIGGAISNGGNVHAWLAQTLRLPDEAALEAWLAEAEPGAHGLSVLPFLYGERNPDYPLDATAVVIGLRGSTRPEEIAQAAIEAVCYRLAAIAARLRQAAPALQGYVVSGGVLRSAAWLQMLTDVLGLPIVVSRVQEATSRGAALMALEALGRLPSALEAPAPFGERLQPDPARHAQHEAARARHEALYEAALQGALGVRTL